MIYSWHTNPLVTGQPQTYYVQLQIKVAYKFPLHVPLVGGIIDRIDGTTDNKFLLDATEQMRIENNTTDMTTFYANVTCNI